MRTKLLICLGLVVPVVCAVAYADVTKGTDGNDDLVVHAISGEPEIAQNYEAAGTGATGPNGETLRADDADDPLDPLTRTYFPGHPYDDAKTVMVGKGGADEFLIRTYISGKPAIVARHVNDDDTVNWNAVAGENDNAHDHWVDYFGTVQINDFNADEGDTIRVQGHTVTLKSLDVVEGDTYIVVYSQQGNGGGAHDEDVLGYIIVRDAELTEDDITFTKTNDGITETFSEFLLLVDYYDAIYEELKKRNSNTIKRRGNK